MASKLFILGIIKNNCFKYKYIWLISSEFNAWTKPQRIVLSPLATNSFYQKDIIESLLVMKKGIVSLDNKQLLFQKILCQDAEGQLLVQTAKQCTRTMLVHLYVQQMDVHTLLVIYMIKINDLGLS